VRRPSWLHHGYSIWHASTPERKINPLANQSLRGQSIFCVFSEANRRAHPPGVFYLVGFLIVVMKQVCPPLWLHCVSPFDPWDSQWDSPILLATLRSFWHWISIVGLPTLMMHPCSKLCPYWVFGRLLKNGLFWSPSTLDLLPRYIYIYIYINAL